MAGGLLAVPVGGVFFVFLFERVGIHVVDSVISGAMDDVRGIEALVVGLFLGIAGLVVAVTVVAALVVPVFVVLPMAVVAVALRVSGAGLIMRTIWLTLAFVIGLAAGVAAVTNLAGARLEWWFCLPVLAVGAFAGRYVVERWRPDRASRLPRHDRHGVQPSQSGL